MYFVHYRCLGCISVSAVHDTDHVLFCSLGVGNGCPQNAFATASSIAKHDKRMYEQMLERSHQYGWK